MKEEAIKRLTQVLPHLRYGVNQAEQNGRPMMGILAVNPDNSGQVLLQFEATKFLDDIASAIGAAPVTDEELASAKAANLLQRFGLARANAT